jgi:hypothetical protein
MPYRRLPTTDKARTRALDAALQKAAFKNGKVAISSKTIEELQTVKSKFENMLRHYEMNIQIQAEKNHEYKAAMDKARMYVSHFIQVLYLTSERGEINGGIKYYGLDDFDGKVPPLNTEEEILYWGQKVVEGEQKRIQSGGSAIYNPSIALVRIKVEEFKDAAIFQNNLKRNTTRTYNSMQELRKTTNDFICQLWNEVEEGITADLPKHKRQIAQEYGLVYIFRRKEKKKLTDKDLQSRTILAVLSFYHQHKNNSQN